MIEALVIIGFFGIIPIGSLLLLELDNWLEKRDRK